jgi:hypothetical protein
MKVYLGAQRHLLEHTNIDRVIKMGKKRIHVKKKKSDNKNHVTLIVQNSSCGVTTKMGGS